MGILELFSSVIVVTVNMSAKMHFFIENGDGLRFIRPIQRLHGPHSESRQCAEWCNARPTDGDESTGKDKSFASYDCKPKSSRIDKAQEANENTVPRLTGLILILFQRYGLSWLLHTCCSLSFYIVGNAYSLKRDSEPRVRWQRHSFPVLSKTEERFVHPP